MNRYWLITKVQLMNVLQKTSKRNKGLHISSLLLGVLLMAGLSAYYMFLLFGAIPAEMYSSLPYFMSYMVVMLIFMMGISTSQGMLFEFKDFDVLMAMPFTEKEMVFSKIAVYTLTEYLYSAALMAPVVIIYGIKVGMGAIFYLLSLLGFLTMPMLAIILASLLGMVIQKISAGRKHKDLVKNLAAVIIVLAIYGISMYFSMSSNGSAGFLKMNDILNNVFLPVKWYMDGAMSGNVLLVLASMAVNIAAYVLFLLLYSRSIVKINQVSNQGYHVANFKVKGAKQNGVFMTLYKKELHRFLQNFLYVFNTAFGMVILMGISIYLVFNSNATIDVLREMLGSSPQLTVMAGQVMILIIVFMGQMTCTTDSSISLEGKCFWIMKTLPVSINQVFWSKMLVNITLIAVPSTISLIMLGIAFQFDWLYFVLGLVSIAATSLFVSLFGLVINLVFPKLEYENDQEVIKQSTAAFLGVFVPMLGGIAALGYFIFNVPDIAYLFEIILGIYVILDVVLYIVLKTYGVKKYRALA